MKQNELRVNTQHERLLRLDAAVSTGVSDLAHALRALLAVNVRATCAVTRARLTRSIGGTARTTSARETRQWPLIRIAARAGMVWRMLRDVTSCHRLACGRTNLVEVRVSVDFVERHVPAMKRR
jgi:hypothetical protein